MLRKPIKRRDPHLDTINRFYRTDRIFYPLHAEVHRVFYLGQGRLLAVVTKFRTVTPEILKWVLHF
jgi:hypothetical protein